MKFTTEYCVMHKNFPGEVRFFAVNRKQAEDWIQEWVDMGGKEDVFYLASREVSEWRNSAAQEKIDKILDEVFKRD